MTRADAGSIRVETTDWLRRQAPKRLNLFFRKCRAHGCDDALETCLINGNCVEITLHDHDGPIIVRRLPRTMKIENDRAFMKEARLRGIQILRLNIRIQNSAPECNDPASLIVDRNNHPIPKSIVWDRNIL